jgi:hypothetical protein
MDANTEEPQMNADVWRPAVKWQIEALEPDSDRNCGVLGNIERNLLIFASIRVHSRYEMLATKIICVNLRPSAVKTVSLFAFVRVHSRFKSCHICHSHCFATRH